MERMMRRKTKGMKTRKVRVTECAVYIVVNDGGGGLLFFFFTGLSSNYSLFNLFIRLCYCNLNHYLPTALCYAVISSINVVCIIHTQ